MLLVAAWIGVACSGSNGPSVAQRYLTIANVGNRSLDRDFDGLESRDADNLSAARVDLRGAAATEHRFDRALLKIAFPPAAESTAGTLVRVNEARAALTERAARSTSIAQLHALLSQLDAANGPVEDQVKTLHKQLGLPPPESS